MTENDVNTAEVKLVVAPKKRGRPRKTVGVTAGLTTAPKKAAVPRTRKTIAPAVKAAVQSEKAAEKPASQLAYVFAIGRRKRALARVFMYKNGKGEIEINGRPLAKYFGTDELRNSALQALNHSAVKKSVHISVQVRGGGHRGQADATCLGIARALLKMDATLRPNFRARGFLTRDPREKERKKPGLKKARRAPQWQKR